MRHVSRRLVLTGVVGTIAVGLAVYSNADAADEKTLTPGQALAATAQGQILLVDIRRPDEWKRTGIAQGAVPIDMRRPDFIAAVQTARRSSDQPIALICARGVRSARMTRLLLDAGLGAIIDVPEGMLGSFAGPGWIKQGLPLQAWTEGG